MSDKYNPYNQLGPIIQQEKKTKNWWLQPKLSHTHTSWDNHLVNQFFSRACSHTVWFIIFFIFFYLIKKCGWDNYLVNQFFSQAFYNSNSTSPLLRLNHDHFTNIGMTLLLPRCILNMPKIFERRAIEQKRKICSKIFSSFAKLTILAHGKGMAVF